jgi:hypothetical protein
MRRLDSSEKRENRGRMSDDKVKEALSRIPADADRTELPRLLDPVLRDLAKKDRAEAEPYLGYVIKEQFGLRKEDIDAYRERVNKYRKIEVEADRRQMSGTDDEPVYTALFDGLVDLVEYNGESSFLIKHDDELLAMNEIKGESVVHIPPERNQIPWLLPRNEEVLKHYALYKEYSTAELDGALFDALLDYHKEISEFSSDAYYDLIVAWDMHTYFLEAFQYSPIICLFAVPERGKSRTGKGMMYVAYRGLHVESLNDPYIVRMAENFRASIFFDVMDIWKKAERKEAVDILLHRYEKGATVPRVMYPELGAFRDTVYFSIFGPTVIGTNKDVHRILETRAITINMPETGRQFENDVRPENALALKEQLVAFRGWHLGQGLPEASKPARGRLGDILRPLLQIIKLVKPEHEPVFLDLVRKLEEGRMLEKAESLEALILRAIIDSSGQVENGILPNKAITDRLNIDRAEERRFSYHRIGRKLFPMGFDKTKTADGASAIIYDEPKLTRICQRYGLDVTSETSDTPETPGQDANETGDTDVSGDSDDMEIPF